MKHKRELPDSLIILRQTYNHEWTFALPRINLEVDEELYEGIDWLEAGNFERAEAIFRKLIKKYPEHLDAYHHLALAIDQRGDGEQATQIWQKAVDLGLKAFPSHFSMQTERLSWGWLDNRPFLLAYHGLGLKLMQRGETEKAVAVFNNLLSINPEDNLGVRAFV